jgi:HD-like signal output (HDOD) protein
MWLALAVGQRESEAWLAGMLLRLGEVLIAQWDKYKGDPSTQHETPPLLRWQLQRERMGFDEGEVMAKAAETWCFPADIVKALDNSAHPLAATKVSPLAAVVHLAAILAELPKVDEKALQALPQEVVRSLGIDLAWISQYLPDPDALVDTSVS